MPRLDYHAQMAALLALISAVYMVWRFSPAACSMQPPFGRDGAQMLRRADYHYRDGRSQARDESAVRAASPAGEFHA